jgi:hypothetical protein
VEIGRSKLEVGLGKVTVRPCLKNKLKSKRTRGMAQVQGPEFGREKEREKENKKLIIGWEGLAH